MSSERKKIMREIDVSSHFNYASLKAVKTAVDELIAEHGEGAKLDLQLLYQRYDPDPIPSAILTYMSPETDEEMQTRIRREKNAKQERKMQYETLKKEFENG